MISLKARGSVHVLVSILSEWTCANCMLLATSFTDSAKSLRQVLVIDLKFTWKANKDSSNGFFFGVFFFFYKNKGKVKIHFKKD